MRFRFFFFLLCFSSSFTHAQNEYLEVALERKLAQHSMWQKLVYYNQSWFSGFKSDSSDPRFFISENGANEPERELLASVSALFHPQSDNPNQHFYCRFPARAKWLIAELGLDASQFANMNCPEYKFFVEQLDAIGATLIFPAAYLDSPASMFGHTFMRLDKRNQTDKNEILSYTINYAAEKQEGENEFSLIVGGLLGTHPGQVSIIPYYLKLKEYRDVESRDIWEYKLNISEQEMSFLVDHVWEIQSINFAYSFLMNNCSYRLLTILDTLREESDMASFFNVYAIPVDTIRVLQAQGWVDGDRYRPSVMINMRHYLDQLSDAEKSLVLDLVKFPEQAENLTETLTLEDKQRLLDVAYRYSRIMQDNKGNAGDVSYQLLLERNKLPLGEVLEEKGRPTVRADQGHFSTRAKFLAGESNGQTFLQGDLRFAYHDFTDPAAAYPRGSSLRFLDMSFRYYEDENFSVEHLEIIGIDSLKPRDEFFNPSSWNVSFGATRNEASSNREFTPYIQGQVGLVYGSDRALFYGMTGLDAFIDSHLYKGNEIYSQSNLGIIGREMYFQWQFDYEYRDPMVSNQREEHKLSWESQLNLTHCWTLGLQASRNKINDVYWSEIGIGLNHFF